MYTCGLGDSPMQISGTLSGNPRRYKELLAANPHKAIVVVGGQPTFKSLGVGEKLNVPHGFVGDSLARAFGVGSHEDAFAKLAQTFGTSDPGDALAKLAHAFGTADCSLNYVMKPGLLGESISGVNFTRVPPGRMIMAGQSINSPNGRAQLRMQSDGNFVLYDANGNVPIWGSLTNGKGGMYAIMQPDGNLVVYNQAHQPLWASGTDRNPGAYLAVQDDGNVVVYVGTRPLWGSGTNGFRKNIGSRGGDIFGDITHAVNNATNTVTQAVHDVGKATGLPTDQVMNVAKNVADQAQKAISSGAQLVAKAGGDVGKFVAARAAAIAKDPLGSMAQIAATGPLALVGNPDDILKALGIPTPNEMLAKVGIPPLSLPNPMDVANGITDPSQLLSHIPGLSALSKFLPAMPNPQDFTKEIAAAASTGDPDKIKAAVIDVGHHVSDSISMVPGVGNVIAGPLATAISALESGSPLRTTLELLLSQTPIPTEIKDVVMRPAIHGLSDIVEKQIKVEDALISAFKEGIMTEVQKRGLPDPAPKLIGDLVDAMIQVVLRNKPLDQAAGAFAQKGLNTAMDEAKKRLGPMLPPGLPTGIPQLPAGLPTGLPTGLPAGLPTGLPAGLPSVPTGLPLPAGIPGLSAAPDAAMGKIIALQGAVNNIKDVADKSNEIYGLTQGIIKLNKQDPQKTNAAIQKQIKDMHTSIEARKLHIQSNTQKLNTSLGKRPPSHIAPKAMAASPTPIAAPTVTTPAPTPVTARAPTPAYLPYPVSR